MTDITPAGVPARARNLGWRAERRPAPGFAHVLGAVSGAFAVIAMVAFVAAVDDQDPQTPGIVLSLVLVAIALAVGIRGSGPLRSAGTTALVLTIPLLWLFALVGDGDGSRGDLRGVLVLSLVSYAALYFFGWTKGRGVFLAAALIALTYWIGFEIAGSGDSSVFGGSFSNDTIAQTQDGGSSESASAAVMLLGLAYLLTGGLLDRRRMAGTATPLLAVGAVAAVIGGVSLAASESTLAGGIVAVLLGAAVGIVGAAGHLRRGTTWFGVLVVFGGLVAVLVDVAPDEEAGIGGIALAIAVVCGALAWWLARVLGEPDDGDDRLPPTAPEGGTSERGAAPGGVVTLGGEAAAA